MPQVRGPLNLGGNKGTNAANGSASTDLATFGQLPSSGTPLSLAQGGTGTSASSGTAVLTALGGTYWLNAYGADPTGATFSDTAMAAAQTAIGSGSGIIRALPGTYKFAGSYSFGPGQGICTQYSNESVVFKYTGTGTFLFSGDSAFSTSNTSPLVSICGPMTGFTIDGTSAGSAAVGLQIGDQNQVNVNVGVQNFTGATSYAFWAACKIGWINYGNVTVGSNNCTNAVVFGDNGVAGVTSLGGINWTFYQTANANQNGVVANSSCQAIGGTFNLFGEYLGGTGTNTGSVISIGSDSTSAGFTNFTEFNVNAESNTGAGNVGHTEVSLGSSGIFYANAGQLVFRNPFSAVFQAASGLATYRFSFDGFTFSQTSGSPFSNPGINGFSRMSMGGTLWTQGATDATHIYNGTGDNFATTLASGANTVAIANLISGKSQHMTWHVTQPASGGAGTLTLTGATTPNGSGVLPLSNVNGATDIVDVWTINGTTPFAAVRGVPFFSMPLPGIAAPAAVATTARLYADANGTISNVGPSGLASRLQQAQYAPNATVTIANSNAIASLGSMTVPANDAIQGAVYRFKVNGFFSTTGTPAVTVDMRWGGTGGTLLTSMVTGTSTVALTTTLASVPLLIEGEVEFYTSTSVTGWLRMTWRNGAATTASVVGLVTISSPVTVTTGSSQAFTVDWTWSAASASNTVTTAPPVFERVA